MTELHVKCQEMLSSMLNPHANAHTIHGRPKLNDVELFKEIEETFNDMFRLILSDCQERKMESNYSTFVPLVVNIVLILFRIVSAQKLAFYGTCASSAKSVVIVFDDHSDVSEKTVQVTVTSLPKENGVPVKINFSKNNYHVGFHSCVLTQSYAQKNTSEKG